MSVIVQEIIVGRTCRLYAMAGEKGCPVWDFLSELKKRKRADFVKAMKLFEYVSEHGTPKNTEKCRYFREERAFELKPSGTVRVMAFWDENQVVICSHGFVKKSVKTPARELEKLRVSRRVYFEAKRANSIEWK